MESDHIILPPPSAKNPIPSLPAALRIDNKERFLDILQENPCLETTSLEFRQLLVFGKDDLRTLLMRQVLQDPHTRTFGKAGKNKKTKNWDESKTFPLPKSLQNNIVGTKLLLKKIASDGPQTTRTAFQGNYNEEQEDAIQTDKDLFTNLDDLFEHVDVITYFLRPWDLDQTTAVISRIQACKSTTKTHHRIVYVPKVTAVCTTILQDHGIWNLDHVTVQGLQLDLFPLESDVLSLEYDEGLKEATEGLPSHMMETTCRALAKLQDVVGTIPRIQTLGTWGEDVLEKFLNQSVDEYWANTPSPDDSSNDPTTTHDVNAAMLLIDRRLDMVTPMVTPLTYEGLLDELVGIDCGHIDIPEAIINPPEQDDQDEPKQGSLNPFDDDNNNDDHKNQSTVALGVHGGDTLYAEVRDQHVEKFGSFLQNQAIALKESHANFTSKETKKDLDEIEKFVKQIPIFNQNLRSVSNHIHLAELIKAHTEAVSFRDQWNTERAMIEGDYCYDFLEECIFENHPPYKVLRLICLQSLASGGIRANRYEQLRQYLVQVYGFEFLPVLHDLESMGWIKKMEGNLATNFVTGDASRSLFQNLRRNLILIHAEVNTMEPDDVSYVSSGYAPLTVRLVQSAMQGWSDKEDVLKDVFSMMAFHSSDAKPSRLLDVVQSHPPLDLPTTLRQQQTKPLTTSLGDFGRNRNSGGSKPTLLVVYLGGITYAEIASLRFLSRKESFPYHIIVVTTKILNGSKLLQQMGQ